MDTLCTAKSKSRSEDVWNCVWYIDCGTSLQDHLFFVLEYMSGGDFKDQLAKVEVVGQKRSQFYAVEITLALQFLHKHGILHR
jgi:serine/threonine protein kinase